VLGAFVLLAALLLGVVDAAQAQDTQQTQPDRWAPLLGAGIAVAGSAIGAGIAIAYGGGCLAAISEKPELLAVLVIVEWPKDRDLRAHGDLSSGRHSGERRRRDRRLSRVAGFALAGVTCCRTAVVNDVLDRPGEVALLVLTRARGALRGGSSARGLSGDAAGWASARLPSINNAKPPSRSQAADARQSAFDCQR
jgi:V/A-type H+-transporting ATPase subunit K